MVAKNIYCFVLVELMACQSIIAQTSGQFGQQVFHELNQSKGLSELKCSYITRDSRGFIWFGGYDGLNKFDGKNVTVYRPSLINGQLDPNISSKIFEDKTGKLWFTTYNSLHCLDPLTNETTPIILPYFGKRKVEDYYAFHLDHEDNLWLVADSTLHLFNVAKCEWDSLHPLGTYVCQVIENTTGKVTGIAVPKPDTRSGVDVFYYKDGYDYSKTSFFTGYELPLARIVGVQTEGDSVLWLSSDIGLIRFPLLSPSKYQVIPLKKNGKITLVWDVAIWESFNLATTINDGLFYFDNKGNLLMNQKEVWLENRMAKLSNLHNALIDTDDNFWVSAWGKGIIFANLRQSKFHHLLKPTVLQPNKNIAVEGIAEARSGQLWCMLPDEGLVIFDENLRQVMVKGKILPINGKASGGKFFNIQTDSFGSIWLQVENNLYISDKADGEFRQIGKNVGSFFQIIQVEYDRFLLLTLTGLFEISKKNQTITDFNQAKPLEKFERVTQMVWDKKEFLFVSTGFDRVSVFKIKMKGVEFVTNLDNMGAISGIAHPANQDYIWLASSIGLIKLYPNKNFSIEYVKGKDKILERSFNAILQDDSLNLWLSSNTGIFKYNPRTGEVKHYTESDGLQGLQFNIGSACKLSDGRMAFGGVNGLNIFHPDSVRDNPNPPIVHFTDWVVNDTGSISSSPDYLPKQVFSYDKRTLTFHFIGIDYTAPEEVKYRYFIEGYDQDIVEAGTSTFARYAQMPPGTYVFEVWAANSDGVWTPKSKRLEFTILQPWYFQWWALILWSLILLSLLYAYYRFRINQIKKQEEMRRMEAEFKQKEAEYKQLAAETETAVLRLQMNPHFIFNSMNSISSYILSRDIDTANEYLGRFARLMRTILNLAAKPRILIADEIELMELYIKTEAMRFEQKFGYNITVGDDIDTEEVLVPTLILQPFVENAIWHGLSSRQGQGMVRIGFEKSGDTLICSVEDNGKGRDAAAKGKEAGHESKALKITERRLQLLSEEKGKPASFEIIDLKDEAGNPTGTRVVIRIPFMEE